MKFRRFLARHFPNPPLRTIQGAVGARRKTIFWCRDRPPAPYRGPFEEHVLIVVREGTVTFERYQEFVKANTTDAILIVRGEPGRLTFIPDQDTRGLTVEITTFDERSIAKLLRTDAALESAAITDAPQGQAAFYCGAMESLLETCFVSAADRIPCAISFAVNAYYCWQLPEIFREQFYQPRWELCAFLERYVTCKEGKEMAARKYEGGEKQLRRDCLFYIGTNLEAILARRRCELAFSWLRCGHTIEDVAKELGFSTTQDFECAFVGTMKKRCQDVQALTPLTQVEPEDLVDALTPFWWKGRELAVENIPSRRMYPSTMMSEAEEDAFVAANPEGHERREHKRRERTKITEELREKAADFFAMKSTGAEVIVPIFNSPQYATKAA